MDSGNQLRILLADGNTNMRTLLAEHLRDDGFLVEEGKDRLEALKMAEEGDCHLMIAEIKMQRMDGMELLERVKQVKPNLPVIMVSGFANNDTVDLLKELGAYEHIWKPYDMKLMQEVLQGAIRSASGTM